jgi:hypothetical protein
MTKMTTKRRSRLDETWNFLGLLAVLIFLFVVVPLI